MTAKQWDKPPEMQIDPEKRYLVTMETTKAQSSWSSTRNMHPRPSIISSFWQARVSMTV